MLRRALLILTLNSTSNQKQLFYDPKDVVESWGRGSGPGGQQVNRESNRITLRHCPTGVIVRCHETRSAVRNKKIAYRLLNDKIDFVLNGENSKLAKQAATAAALKAYDKKQAQERFLTADAEKLVDRLLRQMHSDEDTQGVGNAGHEAEVAQMKEQILEARAAKAEQRKREAGRRAQAQAKREAELRARREIAED